MTTPIVRPEHPLGPAFEEIAQASKAVADRTRELAEAQKHADETQALQETAEAQFKDTEATYNNVKARHSVLAKSLELAAPDQKALQDRYNDRKSELARVQDHLRTVDVQANTVERARTDLPRLFADLRKLEVEATHAIETVRSSAEEIQRLPQQVYRSAAVRNMRDVLQATYDELQERRAGYEVALRDLGAAMEALRDEIPFAGYREELRRTQERLERDLAETGRKLAAEQPSIDQDELRRASDDRKAAKFAMEEASKAVQRAQAGLRAASDSLARAEASLQAAHDQLDQIEAEFVAGIDVSAPNAAGIVTARAQITRTIPVGYALRWQAGAASVSPETGNVVSIDTSQLPVGETIIEARLVRIHATA